MLHNHRPPLVPHLTQLGSDTSHLSDHLDSSLDSSSFAFVRRGFCGICQILNGFQYLCSGGVVQLSVDEHDLTELQESLTNGLLPLSNDSSDMTVDIVYRLSLASNQLSYWSADPIGDV